MFFLRNWELSLLQRHSVFCSSFYSLSSPFFSLPLLAGSPPPSPLKVLSFIFVARRLISVFSFLVDCRRIAPAGATRSQQSLPFFFPNILQINKLSPRWDFNATESILAVFEGTAKPPGRPALFFCFCFLLQEIWD